MSLLIVGPGAVGLTLAARWAATGRQVLLLGRTAAEEKALARGFTFEGLDGERRRIHKFIASARGARRQPMLAAFFCTKATDLTKAGIASRPWIGPATAIVGLQNGLGHEKVLHRLFGTKRVVIGSSYFAADRPEPGVVTNSWGNAIRLAASPRNAQAVAVAQTLLLEGGWDVQLKKSEDRLLWTKLCFNAATNPLGALCGVTNGKLAEDPALRELVMRTLRECVAIALKRGHKPLYPDMEDVVLRSCRAAPRQRNSMLQDLAAGRRTELDAIAGPVLRAGRAPLLAALSRWMRALEASA